MVRSPRCWRACGRRSTPHVSLPVMTAAIEHVSDTARWVALYRAMESERPDALFDRIGAAARQVLIVSEGLLVYLTPEAVASLATDLAVPASFRRWLIDLASPRLLKMMEKSWGQAVAAGNAPFLFAPPRGTRFFEPHGWREAEFRSMWEESLRLKRTMPLAWLWNLVGKLYPKSKRDEFRRMSGIVLLERT